MYKRFTLVTAHCACEVCKETGIAGHYLTRKLFN